MNIVNMGVGLLRFWIKGIQISEGPLYYLVTECRLNFIANSYDYTQLEGYF